MTQFVINFSVSSFVHLIGKDSLTNMLVLSVYVKEGHPFARDLSQENFQDFCF